MEHMGVYLTNSKNKTIELPVAPAEFLIKKEKDSEKAVILGLGEINRMGLNKAIDLSIESTLPVNPKQAPWCTAQKLLSSAQAYIDWLNAAKDSSKPVRVVLSGTHMNLSVNIVSFEYGFQNGNSNEYAYTLALTEYHEIKAIKTVIKQKVVPKKPAPRPKPPKKIGIGSTVIVNGRLHRDSYGSGPGVTERNATRKINFIAKGRKYPYHVTLLNGGWRGWVTAGSVKAK